MALALLQLQPFLSLRGFFINSHYSTRVIFKEQVNSIFLRTTKNYCKSALLTVRTCRFFVCSVEHEQPKKKSTETVSFFSINGLAFLCMQCFKIQKHPRATPSGA